VAERLEVAQVSLGNKSCIASVGGRRRVDGALPLIVVPRLAFVAPRYFVVVVRVHFFTS
jgi:hypothetical protein